MPLGRARAARDKDLHRGVTTSVDVEAFREADRVDDGLHTAGWKSSTTWPEGSCSRTCLPPGPGLAPSGMGRPAELVGPLSSSRRLPRVTLANAGPELVSTSKSRNFV